MASLMSAENVGRDAVAEGLSSPSRRRHRRGSAQTAEADAPLVLPARLLSGVVVVSVLAVGSVHLPVLAAVAAVTFAATALLFARSAGMRAGAVLPAPALACAALSLFTVAQAIPLPMGLLEALSPATADVWQRSLAPLGEAGPRWASLSLDPGASLVEALKWATYAGVFAVSAAVAARRGAHWGVSLVFVAAVAAALTTLGHGLAGATSVYGFYKPTFSALPWHVGPLLNPNNLAGYLNLGALAGLALLLGHRRTLPTWVLWPGVATLVGVELTAASRAATLLLPVGVVALAIVARRREQADRAGGSTSTVVMLLSVVGGGALAVLGSTSAAWSELVDKNLSKLDMVGWAAPMLRDRPWFGVGRGAFESTFPLYRRAPGNVVFTHAENFPVQWAAEWGLPVAAAALCFFVWAFAPKRLGLRRSIVATGAFIGVLVLLAQNLVDLALEIPAVCIALATVLGSLWGGAQAQPHAPEEGHRPRLPARWGRVAGVVVPALGIALLLPALRWGHHGVAADRDALRDALASVKLDGARAEALRVELREAMRRHPAEPYFPLAGGLIAARVGDRSPIPWIQRTLELAQVNGRAHLLLAEVLAGRGARRQALLELRLAAEHDPDLTGRAGADAARWARDFDEVLVATPEGKAGAPMLSAIGGVLATVGQADLRARVDREALRRDPSVTPPRFREASARVEALATGKPSALCPAPKPCRDEVVDHLEVIAAAEPDRSRALQIEARLLLAEGRPEEAVRRMEQTCDRFVDRDECLEVRALAASRVKASTALDAASRDLLQATCVSAKRCARSAAWLGDLRLQRGEHHMALSLLGRATQEDPLDEGLWLRLADAATTAGAHVQAAESLEKVARLRGGADAALQKRIDAARRKVLDTTLAP